MTIRIRIRRARAALALVSLLAAVACTGSNAATSPVAVDGSPAPPAVSPAPKVCPHTLPDPLPRHAVPGVADHMVPDTPGALVICVSRSRTVVDQADVANVARDLNRLQLVPSPHIFACPVDFGPTYALFFDYPDGSRLLVEVHASGCRFATNGRITGSSDARLLKLLGRLTA